MNRPKSVIIIVILVAVLVSVYALLSRQPGIKQPIAFNHLLHTEELGVECTECHQYYMEYATSGLPDGEICSGCHEEQMTDSSEEGKLVSMLESGNRLNFNKLFYLPDHVYYSHRRHVAIAELECETCHGEIAMTVSPPGQPLVKVDMDYCMDCHDDHGVTNDCITCHR